MQNVHTLLLPPVSCGGHLLNFWVDLLKDDGFRSFLATCAVWCFLKEIPPDCVLADEDDAYDYASTRYHELVAQLDDSLYAKVCCETVLATFKKYSLFPELSPLLKIGANNV